MYSEIKDELLNLERFNQLNELQTKYESEKKEKQIQYQKTNIENQNVILERNRFQIIALIISLAFFILFAYFF
jgi:glutaredoxin-related protein